MLSLLIALGARGAIHAIIHIRFTTVGEEKVCPCVSEENKYTCVNGHWEKTTMVIVKKRNQHLIVVGLDK